MERYKRKYIVQILIAIDQLANTLIGGWADETISARAYRQNHKKKWKITEKIINLLFFFEKDHCQVSFESEEKRNHLPPAYRD